MPMALPEHSWSTTPGSARVWFLHWEPAPGRDVCEEWVTASPCAVSPLKVWALRLVVRIFSGLLGIAKGVCVRSGAEGREGRPWRFCASPTRPQDSGISYATGLDSPLSFEVQSQGDLWLILLDLPSAVGRKSTALPCSCLCSCWWLGFSLPGLLQ